MTIEEFGQTIKAKYPQYQDMSDADLGQRMLAKFPQYNDMVTGGLGVGASLGKPVSNQGIDTSGVGGFIANQFLGAGPVDQKPGFFKGLVQKTIGSEGIAGTLQLPGRAIAGAITGDVSNQFAQSALQLQQMNDKIAKAYSVASPDKKPELLKQMRENETIINHLVGRANSKEFTDYNITPEQALGTGINAATTIASSGAPTPASFLGKTAVGAATGAGYAAGTSMNQNKPAGEVAKDTFVGALTGGAVSAALAGIGALVDKYVTPAIKKTPERLYNDALKVNQRIIQHGKSPSKQLIDEGIYGDLGTIYNESEAGAKAMNAKIAAKLENNDSEFASDIIKNTAFNRLKKQFANTYSDTELRAALAKVPANLLTENSSNKLGALNGLRTELDSLLGGQYFVSDAASKLNKDATAALANTLRDVVQKYSGTTSEFAKLTSYIRAQNLVKAAVAKADKTFGFKVRDLFAGGIGAAIGSSFGSPTVGAAAGYGIEKFAQSPQAKTAAAVGLDRLIKTVQQLPTDQAGNISKTALINLLTGNNQ